MPISKTITLSYPHDAVTPTASVTIPAPERENTLSVGRHVVMAKMRSGINRVYDRGEDADRTLRWQFKEITDTNRTALVAFLDIVKWGVSPVKLVDWLGAERVVRITSQNIDGINTFEYDRGETCGIVVHWNFSLDLVDITNNLADIAGQEPPVPSALVLHLADYNHPHNPLIQVDVQTTATMVDEFLLEDHHTVIYTVALENETDKAVVILSVSTNRDYENIIDAASAAVDELHREDIFGPSTDVTFSVELIDAGVLQKVRLNCIDAGLGGWKLRARRVKL